MIGSTETSVNIIESTEARIPTRAADLERYRLRRFVAELPSDEIEIRREPIDLAGVAEALEGNPRAVMFAAVGPERQQLVGNVTGSRARIARAFGVAPGELVAEGARRRGAGCHGPPTAPTVLRSREDAKVSASSPESRGPVESNARSSSRTCLGYA